MDASTDAGGNLTANSAAPSVALTEAREPVGERHDDNVWDPADVMRYLTKRGAELITLNGGYSHLAETFGIFETRFEQYLGRDGIVTAKGRVLIEADAARRWAMLPAGRRAKKVMKSFAKSLQVDPLRLGRMVNKNGVLREIGKVVIARADGIDPWAPTAQQVSEWLTVRRRKQDSPPEFLMFCQQRKIVPRSLERLFYPSGDINGYGRAILGTSHERYASQHTSDHEALVGFGWKNAMKTQECRSLLTGILVGHAVGQRGRS